MRLGMTGMNMDQLLAEAALKRKQEAFQALAAMQAPQRKAPVTPVSSNQAMMAGGIGLLASLFGARQPYVQAGLGNYFGGLQQNAQRQDQANELDFQNQMQTRESQLNQAKLSLGFAEDAAVRADKRVAARDARMDRQATQQDYNLRKFMSMVPRIDSSAQAETYVQMAQQMGLDDPTLHQNLRDEGTAAQKARADKARMDALKVPVKGKADAMRVAQMMGLRQGDPGFNEVMAIGANAEAFHAQYHMTKEEKRAYDAYLQALRQNDRMDLQHDRQTFEQWKSETGWAKAMERATMSQDRQDSRTKAVRDSVERNTKARKKPPTLGGEVAPAKPALPQGFKDGTPNPSVKAAAPKPKVAVSKPAQSQKPKKEGNTFKFTMK